MSSTVIPGYEIAHGRAAAFYKRFERKGELQHQTHYCPGCGHGTIHKMLARAIDEFAIQDRTIMISPVGCSVFVYEYFDTGNVQAAHPHSIVVSYQGDGDLAAIGTAEIVHAANRGEPITVIFVNNAIYSMTGGQMAPTTLIGQKSQTSPRGRDPINDGYPIHISEMLATLDAPVYIERVGLGDTKQIMQAGRAIRRAVENQVKGLGFSLIEVLSPCPTIWKKSPVEAQRWVKDVMEKTFPLGVFRDHTKEATPRPEPRPAPALEDIPGILGIEAGSSEHEQLQARQDIDLHIRVAGFGGQGVLLLGEILAEAGLDADYDVSWLPSYGPEMRSGTSNCHVRISSEPIDTPLVATPDILVAMNEPSLRKFDRSVRPGGWIVYNGAEFPEDCRHPEVRVLAQPFTEIADGLGSPRVANMVMLGSVLELAQAVPAASVDEALRRLVHSSKWMEIDKKALARGRELAREQLVLA
jgi:2-oxoisovalerate ferredoxin oxidoreductase beta subunit